jgi:alpha-mannosidase
MSSVREILLVGHTHHDVGYTNSPRIVDSMHSRIVGEVLDLCDEHAETGPEQFRWTFEVARPVLGFLRNASAEDRERLRDRVAEGRISVTGGYLNMTQLTGEPEFAAAYEALSPIRDSGIDVRTQQHGDVNGISWGTVPQMRRAGIDRLFMALNPDHGRAPFVQPGGFWWESPGGDPLFVWLSTHYGLGEEWGIVDGDAALAERRILSFVECLDRRDDYPFETAIVHAGNDNRWPTALFLDVVRAWNREHPEIPMRTATIDQGLDTLQEQARRADLPTVRGEWSDWWAHGHGSTAREVAVYRQARSDALAAQAMLGMTALRGDGDTALATVLGYRRGPVRRRDRQEIMASLAEVDEQLLLFGEHTWGSWETYSKPHSHFSYSHWNAKASFAYAAYDHARDLAVEGLFRLMPSGAEAGVRPARRSIAVVNTVERERTEPVSVEIDGAEIHTVVVSVPAFGAVTVPIPERPAGRDTGYEISAGRYRAVVDPRRGGVVSLTDRTTGRELVDQSGRFGLGAVVLEQPAGEPHPMAGDPKRFRPEDPGPAFSHRAATGTEAPHITRTEHYTAISWAASAPTVPAVSTTLRIYHAADVLDLEVSMRKPEVFGPESIFVSFPFGLAEPTFLLETAGAVYQAGKEQLPDTSRDWYSIQHAVGVASSEAAILWGSLDAPLVQLGGFHTGQWARELNAPKGHVNSWLMNNLHFTNFQARQDGTGTYRYRFAPDDGGPGLRQRVRVFGRDLGSPLRGRQYDGPVALDGPTGLRVEPAGGVLAEVRPVEEGVRVRLRNPGPDMVWASVSWNGAGAATESTVLLDGYGTEDVTLILDH